MLHVVNGDGTLERLTAAGVEGAIISGDDLLMEGPLPRALQADSDWEERAAWLEAALHIPRADYLARRAEREARIAKEPGGIVLWSEADLHCQTNLLYWIRLCADKSPLSLACPAKGRLSNTAPAELAALPAELVLRERVDLASKVWSALCGPDPTHVVRLLPALDAWPAMQDAMRLHLARFPSPVTGLDLLDQTLLLQAALHRTFTQAVHRIGEDPSTSGYGASDVVIRHRLGGLHDAGLVRFDDSGEAPLATTEQGEAVLAGEDLPRGLPARWVGGVLLDPDRPAWRWDGERLLD